MPRRIINREGYHALRYKKLKARIYKRDRGVCRMPNCKNKGRQMHHIKRWADFPELRYSDNNVILLCLSCHKKVFGKEDAYAPLFYQIIRPVADIEILKIKYGI